MALRNSKLRMVPKIKALCCVVSMWIFSCNVFAEGTILEIEGATIRGNQELPTVLYVVPWKPAKVYSLEESDQSLASMRPISTIERSSFRRVLQYHQQFVQSEEALPDSENVR